MRKTFMLTLAIAAAALGSVPLAQAQPMDPHGMDQRPMDSRGMDHGRPPAGGPGRFVPAPQRAQLHAKLQSIDNDVAAAQKGRRISYPQGRDLHHQLSVLEQRLYGQARKGLTNDEFNSIDEGANRVRQQLSNTAPYGGPPHRH